MGQPKESITGKLRRVEYVGGLDFENTVKLQQEWIDENGSLEWRDIPIDPAREIYNKQTNKTTKNKLL